MSQYTLTGFDASAHLSEETRKASWSAPIGVVSSVGFSSLFGFFVLLSFLFSIQDFKATVGSNYGQPVLQIFVDIFGDDGAVVSDNFLIVPLFCLSEGICPTFLHTTMSPYSPSGTNGHAKFKIRN
jgi:amino acid transporter